MMCTLLHREEYTCGALRGASLQLPRMPWCRRKSFSSPPAMPGRSPMNGWIIGGGMTGLAAGMTSGFPVLEGLDHPGGICASYEREGYRFELGGGHWIFGSDPTVTRLIAGASEVRTYRRRSAVLFLGAQEYSRDLRSLPRALYRWTFPRDRPARRLQVSDRQGASPPRRGAGKYRRWLQCDFSLPCSRTGRGEQVAGPALRHHVWDGGEPYRSGHSHSGAGRWPNRSIRHDCGHGSSESCRRDGRARRPRWAAGSLYLSARPQPRRHAARHAAGPKRLSLALRAGQPLRLSSNRLLFKCRSAVSSGGAAG